MMSKYELIQLIKAIEIAAHVADNECQLDEEELQLIRDHIKELQSKADAMEG